MCIAHHSNPPTNLSWYINGEPVSFLVAILNRVGFDVIFEVIRFDDFFEFAYFILCVIAEIIKLF